MSERLEELEIENEKLRDRVSQHETCVIRMDQQRAAAEARAQRYRASVDKYIDENEKLRVRVENYRRHVEKFGKRIADLELDRDEGSEELERMKHDFEDARRRCDDRLSRYDRCVKVAIAFASIGVVCTVAQFLRWYWVS